MDWERIGTAVGRFFLAIIEYCFKLFALISAGIVLGTQGGFTQQLSAGFTSLSGVLRQLTELPQTLSHAAFIIKKYNALSSSAFTESYGTHGIDSVLSFLNNGVLYFGRVADNFSNRPLLTTLATFMLFGCFYLLAWVVRFARQKGKGSWKTRLERKLGKRVFKVVVPIKPVPISSTPPVDSPSPKASPVTEEHISAALSGPGSAGRELTEKKKGRKKSPSPTRDEPAWLTNSRKSTKAKKTQTSDAQSQG